MKREILWFLVAGFSAVGTDMGTYYLLLNWLDHSPAKAISFVLGSAVAYVLNKVFTFQKQGHSNAEILKFAALYSFTLAANVLVNRLSLALLPGFTLLAFLAATGTSTVLNYLGQKFWVFR